MSVASVVKWSRRFRATGSAAAKKMGGWRQLLLKSEREWLLARIAEKPDLTLRAVVAELGERGTPASYGAVWRFFKHEGITFKKSLFASEQDRADVARLAALRCDRITAPCVIDGPINGTSFRAGACPGEGRGRAISSSPR